MLLLRRIPLGRDVRIRSREDDQRLCGAGSDLPVLGVGARQVADQSPWRRGGAIQHERQMRGEEPVRLRDGDERRERMALEKGEKRWLIAFSVRGRDVHGSRRTSCAWLRGTAANLTLSRRGCDVD